MAMINVYRHDVNCHTSDIFGQIGQMSYHSLVGTLSVQLFQQSVVRALMPD